MSVVNEPIVRSLWAARSAPDHLTGITGFTFDADIGAEERFVGELATIDLHHGPHSTETPYTELDVVGVQLTAVIRAALSERGFTRFIEGQNGFVATRSAEEASRRRT
jgi:hypothetical protein